MTVASYADEQALIFEHLANNWTSASVAKPNTQFSPTDRTPYVEARIRNQSAFNAAIGSTKRVRHPGLLTLVVKVPLNRGDAVALDYADELADVFRNLRLDAIHFRAPSVRPFGEQNGWYEVHVDCPYHRDSVF